MYFSSDCGIAGLTAFLVISDLTMLSSMRPGVVLAKGLPDALASGALSVKGLTVPTPPAPVRELLAVRIVALEADSVLSGGVVLFALASARSAVVLVFVIGELLPLELIGEVVLREAMDSLFVGGGPTATGGVVCFWRFWASLASRLRASFSVLCSAWRARHSLKPLPIFSNSAPMSFESINIRPMQ